MLKVSRWLSTFESVTCTILSSTGNENVSPWKSVKVLPAKLMMAEDLSPLRVAPLMTNCRTNPSAITLSLGADGGRLTWEALVAGAAVEWGSAAAIRGGGGTPFDGGPSH